MTEVLNNDSIETEDGEIIDDEAPIISTPADPINNLCEESEEEDENPDEILNSVVKQCEERKAQQQNDIDPKLCKVCLKNEHKYRCPRCDLRSCSLECSRKHKIDNNCDGVRQKFVDVQKLSDYDNQKSIDDQKFIYNVKEKIGLGAENINNDQSVDQTLTRSGQEDCGLRFSANSAMEKYLLNATRSRRVWLGFTKDNVEHESRHEQFSDTVFWTIKITFMKKSDDDSVTKYEKIVHNIPESIRLTTVLKQFLKPRKFGCLVSESDLDLSQLEPFMNRGIDDLNVFMEVYGTENKFYGIITDDTIINNTRNRVIADFPKLIITLNDEFTDLEVLNAEECEQISNKFGGFYRTRPNGPGRGRGGFNRGGGFQRGGNRKRQNHNSPYNNNFKRGRGGHNGPRRNFSNSHDSFDPFEPFSGPNSLPVE